jgi:hypothetical protein
VQHSESPKLLGTVHSLQLPNPASANSGALAVFKGARSAKPQQPIGLRDTGKRRAEVGTTGQQVSRTLLPVISNKSVFNDDSYNVFHQSFRGEIFGDGGDL